MKANYHTHTPRCLHAQGTETDYIQAAIAAGFQVLGFADHTPWPYASGYVSNIRMLPDQLEEYLSCLKALKARHQDEITLRIGLECEYFPKYLDYLKMLRERTDYLLLGMHWIGTEETEPYTGRLCEEDDGVKRYADATCEAMATGMFAYLAHPDLYMRRRTQWNKTCEEAADQIVQAAREYHLPLEFNLNGEMLRRRGEQGFPCPEFWQRAAICGVPAMIGVDAHQPDILTNTALWNESSDYLTGLGLPLMPCLPMDNDL